MPSEIESFSSSISKVFHTLRESPSLIVLLGVLYVTFAFAVYQNLQQRKGIEAAKVDLERQQMRLVELEQQRNSLEGRGDANKNIDIFKNLSFDENRPSEHNQRFNTALSLNSFAKYALSNGDLSKARETLEQSVHTYSTQEAQYYIGVVAYLEGHVHEAINIWRPLVDTNNSPADLLFYLSVAEYRTGNIEAARQFADGYVRSARR